MSQGLQLDLLALQVPVVPRSFGVFLESRWRTWPAPENIIGLPGTSSNTLALLLQTTCLLMPMNWWLFVPHDLYLSAPARLRLKAAGWMRKECFLEVLMQDQYTNY